MRQSKTGNPTCKLRACAISASFFLVVVALVELPDELAGVVAPAVDVVAGGGCVVVMSVSLSSSEELLADNNWRPHCIGSS